MYGANLPAMSTKRTQGVIPGHSNTLFGIYYRNVCGHLARTQTSASPAFTPNICCLQCYVTIVLL